MRILYFDCFSGASGDMVLGSLIDAGVALDDVRRALGTLTIAPDAVWSERVMRAGIQATRFCVRGEHAPADGAAASGHVLPSALVPTDRASDHPRDHHHDHDHHHHHHDHDDAHSHQRDDAAPGRGRRESHERGRHHGHRSLAEIGRLIDGSGLSEAGKTRAKALFSRLGEAEAAIHGTTLEQVHLHEVGALDSIIDIVGAVYALEALGVDRVVASPVNVGGGMIRSAHGTYPVPAPATARLLQHVPIYSAGPAVELTTPTGALLVTGYASQFGPVPAMRVDAIGYGAGTRDFPDTPNVLRVLIGDADARASAAQVVVLEAEIDDMNPQIYGVLMDALLAHGALDVFYTPIQMKKNRPGTLLTVVARPEAREGLTAIVFRETTTIGLRYREMLRECLERDDVVVQTALGAVRMKVARRDGQVLNAAPEFEDCARIARERDVPLKDVQALAMKAFLT